MKKKKERMKYLRPNPSVYFSSGVTLMSQITWQLLRRDSITDIG